jgi:hypothetical protein
MGAQGGVEVFGENEKKNPDGSEPSGLMGG